MHPEPWGLPRIPAQPQDLELGQPLQGAQLSGCQVRVAGEVQALQLGQGQQEPQAAAWGCSGHAGGCSGHAWLVSSSSSCGAGRAHVAACEVEVVEARHGGYGCQEARGHALGVLEVGQVQDLQGSQGIG